MRVGQCLLLGVTPALMGCGVAMNSSEGSHLVDGVYVGNHGATANVETSEGGTLISISSGRQKGAQPWPADCELRAFKERAEVDFRLVPFSTSTMKIESEGLEGKKFAVKVITGNEFLVNTDFQVNICGWGSEFSGRFRLEGETFGVR